MTTDMMTASCYPPAGLKVPTSLPFVVDFFAGAAGRRIRYAHQPFANTRGTVLIVTGRAEFIEKYLEVAADLQTTGFSICIYDHAGQGGSDRLLADRQKGHIDDFSTYVEDLRRLICRLLEAGAPRPLVLLAHSMGGTVAVLAVARCPHLVDRLVLTSPMLQINTGPLPPSPLVAALTRLVCRCGGATRYVWGGGPLRTDVPFVGNELTNDPRRFALNLQLAVDYPELVVGSPTFGWLHQAFQAMPLARAAAKRLACPVLLLVALADRIVSVPAIQAFGRALGYARIMTIEAARHELLMEQDHLRGAAIEAIQAFLKRQDGPGVTDGTRCR